MGSSGVIVGKMCEKPFPCEPVFLVNVRATCRGGISFVWADFDWNVDLSRAMAECVTDETVGDVMTVPSRAIIKIGLNFKLSADI